jgi:hypothetical protein
VHLVEVLVEQNRDLEQGPCGGARHPNAAVPLQPEERAQAFLAAAGRAERDQRVRDAGADVRETVARPGRDDQDVARPKDAAPPADPEAQFAGDALEALPLARVHVRRHVAAGADEELRRDALRRALAEDDQLARDGIRDGVYASVDRPI